MTTFALVHGGGSSGWDLHLLAEALRERGHDAVTPDLPVTDPTAGFAEHTATVVEALRGRTGDVAVVGHSYGGFTAPLVAERVSARLLVYLAAMVPSPGEPPARWWDAVGFTAAEGLSEDEQFYGGVADPLVVGSRAHAQEQRSREYDEPWPLDAHPDVPTRVLLCRDDRFFAPDLQRRVARERLGLTADEIDGSHMVALGRPAALADRLLAYL